jgi:hypothetical protein
MSAPMNEQQLAEIAVLIGEAKPATDALLVQLGESVRDRLAHDHSTQREDLYCMNLTSYMGERMGPVLRRLLDAEAEVVSLRAERHSTNEALSDAVEALRVQRDRIAELEARLNAVAEYATSRVTGPEATNEVSASWVLHLLAVDHDSQNPIRPCGCSKRFDRHAWGCPTLPADDVPLLRQPEDPHDSIPTFSASEIARWQARQLEDPHTSELHHEYALGRDLPVIPQQTTGRCPRCRRLFEDCTCGGGS